jgi:hypothetical protein
MEDKQITDSHIGKEGKIFSSKSFSDGTDKTETATKSVTGSTLFDTDREMQDEFTTNKDDILNAPPGGGDPISGVMPMSGEYVFLPLLLAVYVIVRVLLNRKKNVTRKVTDTQK